MYIVKNKYECHASLIDDCRWDDNRMIMINEFSVSGRNKKLKVPEVKKPVNIDNICRNISKIWINYADSDNGDKYSCNK